MPKKNNEQHAIQQITTQARAPMVPSSGYETRELEHIRQQTAEMIARETGITKASEFALRCREYLYEVGLEEVTAATHYAQKMIVEAHGSMFEKEILEYIYHSEQLLQRDMLGLQDATARRLYEEVMRQYTPAKPPWYKLLDAR